MRLLVACCVLLATAASAQQPGDFEALTRSAAGLGPPPGALPGEVLAFGGEAFVVASVGKKDTRRGIIAGANFKKGRVLAFGHNAFLGGWQAGGFMDDAIGWAGRGRLDDLNVFVLGGGPGLEAVYAEKLDGIERQSALPSLAKLKYFDVVAWVGGDLAGAELDKLEDFVAAGGGLLFGTCPWGRQQIWSGQGGGLSIRSDLGHNTLARRFGLVFGADTAGGSGYDVKARPNAELHAGRAAERVIAQLDGSLGDVALAGDAARVAALLRALPVDDALLLPRIEAALAGADLASHVPAAGKPVSAGNVAGHLGMLLATTTWKELAAERVPAAPGADFFPGAVPSEAPRATHEVALSKDAVAVGGWQSTGLYAAPGEVVRARVTSGNANGWSLRIGAHKDTLWHKDKWSRWPEVTLEHALTDGGNDFASPFGGLIYLVPGRGAKAATFELMHVVEAPYFDLRVTEGSGSLADWERRRTTLAPWGELACDGVILTLPAPALRKLDDPAALMQWWDESMRCYPELRGEPQPTAPERLVEDIQISAGWMHSGYPVMTHGADNREHSAACDLATLSTKGDWGYFHEFGHNAQKRDWTFAGTGEVTNNLFSLYVNERMAHLEAWHNPWLENQKAKPAAYFASGAPFDEWKRQPGLALMMYATVQRDFGWPVIKAALASYLSLPPAKRPKDDAAKHDRWLIELSHATDRNLGPYFQKWGLPTSEAARASVANLQPWMPEEYDS